MDEQEPTNVFSLSDQVLSDQLYFIGEVSATAVSEVVDCHTVHRLDAGTGEVYGYVVPERILGSLQTILISLTTLILQ
jgi:hypothetical protein